MESMGNDKRTHKMYRPVKIHFIQMLYVHTHISEMAFAHRFLQNFPYYEIPLSFLLLCSSARPPSLVLWKCLMMFGVGERDFPHLDLLPGETERPRAPRSSRRRRRHGHGQTSGQQTHTTTMQSRKELRTLKCAKEEEGQKWKLHYVVHTKDTQ